MQQPDADLVRRAKRREQEALEEIYERYQASVFTYIFYRVGDQCCAEDLTAEVFVRMLTNLNRYVPGKRPLLAWLYTIARNLVADHYRETVASSLSPLDENLASDETTHPVQIVEYHFDQECLARAMKYLTEEQNLVILLKFMEERENSEVAAILGKNERAIRSLQHRALAALSRAIKKERCYDV